MVVVLAAGVGGLLWWQSEQARQSEQEIIKKQDARWASVLAKVDDMYVPTEVGAEGTYFVIRSQPGGTCTSAEAEAWYDQNVSSHFSPPEWMLVWYGVTRASAAADCNYQKQTNFTASVVRSLSSATDIFNDLGAPESVIAQLESTRGLDGTQERELAGTYAGDLKLVIQYDGLNGVQVRVERASEAS